MSGGCDAYNSIRGIVDGKVVESSYSGNDGQAAVYDIMAVERGVKEALARKGGRNVVVVDGKLTPEEARAMFKVSIVNNCG